MAVERRPIRLTSSTPSPIVERDIVDAAGRRPTPALLQDYVDISECLVRTASAARLDADGIGNVTADAAYIRPDMMQPFDGGPPTRRSRYRRAITFMPACRQRPGRARTRLPPAPPGHEMLSCPPSSPHHCPCHLPDYDRSPVVLPTCMIAAADRLAIFDDLCPHYCIRSRRARLVDTAPDLINALNFVLGREGLPPGPRLLSRAAI